MRPLIKNEYEKLEWEGIFKDFNLIRIRTDMDGSCFFHALAKAYFKPYILGKIDNEPFDRKEFIKNLRKDLSKKLGMKKGNKTYYELLSKGELAKTSKEMPQYSLENMQKELDSYSPVSNIYNEFISNQLNLDIYILNSETKDVYMTGTDEILLYKNRRSVVILYLPGHYELIGVMYKDGVETVFSPNSKFIGKIRKRMKELIKT